MCHHCEKKHKSKKCYPNCSGKELVGPNVTLKYQSIDSDFWPDQTGSIDHQFTFQPVNSQQVLEKRNKHCIPIDRTIPSTQPNPDAPVYGYNEDGSLDLNGGRQKSYLPSFKKFQMECHQALEGKYDIDGSVVTLPLQYLNNEKVNNIMNNNISYFASRGFTIQDKDTYEKFSNQYVWTVSNGQGATMYVAIRTIWDNCKKGIPKFVDLHASANPFYNFSLDTYQANPSLKKNGFGYPVRIPVTVDFNIFQNLYNSSPIAYYDVRCNVLSIHVPENENGYYLFKTLIDTGNPGNSVDREEWLLAFDGSFSLLRRNSKNELVSSKAKCADLLAQVSQEVYIKSRARNTAESPIEEFEQTQLNKSTIGKPSVVTNKPGLGPFPAFYTNASPQTDVTGQGKLAGNPPYNVCTLLPSNSLQNKVGVMRWSEPTCDASVNRVQRMIDAGAIGAVIVNDINATRNFGGNSGIPNVYLFSSVGEPLITALENDPNIELSIVILNYYLYYTGMVCPLLNGGNSKYDVYLFPYPDYNAAAAGLDPLQPPFLGDYKDPDEIKARSQPPVVVQQSYWMVSSMILWDYDWTNIILMLPISFLSGNTYYPETLDISPIPAPSTSQQAFQSITAHEFTHQWQFSSGLLGISPFGVEGTAMGIEMDTKISAGGFTPFRAGRITTIIIPLVRGTVTMMSNDSQTNTYGLGIFWEYIRSQFDFNNQAMRRMMDIMTSETAEPLFKANGFPWLRSVRVINNSGGNVALKQSFQELFSKDIRDVWHDFSISLTLLRNNESIPAKYRSYWPYWIYNTSYPGYPELVDSLNTTFGVEFANWWEIFDTNSPIPASWGTNIGESVIPKLPTSVTKNVKNLMTVSYTVPNNTNQVTITITKGEWRLTLLQFTSDGTPVGNFIIDGPHTIVENGVHVFNVASHVPAFTAQGSIRLVCSNVSFSGTGTVLSDYFSNEPNTGTIKIVRN